MGTKIQSIYNWAELKNEFFISDYDNANLFMMRKIGRNKLS